MRKLPLFKYNLTSRGIFGIVCELHYCYEQRNSSLVYESWEATIEVRQKILGISWDENDIGYLSRGFRRVNLKNGVWKIRLWIPSTLGKDFPKFHWRV
ncbi:UNVERIFIED_CONTAM: hypothetical protein Sindi_0717200, partial [Sesamum indicum]